MDNLFIARQPIYDKELKLMGYELLYRDSDINSANFDDGNQASTETIINSFMHIGIDNLTGSALAFINLPTQFIVNESMTPMFQEQTVLEILEDVEPTPQVINGLRRLKLQGYSIALDDFEYADKFKPFLELADFVKIDVLNQDEESIRQQVTLFESYPLKLIAEKVETQELYALCQDLGIDYYQGYFFCRPQMLKKKHLPANKMVVLNLMQLLQDPETDYDKLETTLAQDVALSYKLLRYINSAAFSLRREIDSIKDAIVLLGVQNIKNWASLIMMTRVVENKPQQLIVTAMTRARMCELLAEQIKPNIKSQMFIVGLFSILDALMDMPMIDLLDTVILSTAIKMALLDHMGDHGEILKQVLDYEQGNWDALNQSGIDTSVYSETYMNAIQWADQNINSLC